MTRAVCNALIAAAEGFIALMLDGVAAVLAALRNVPGIGGRIGAASDAVSAQAQSIREKAVANAGVAGTQLVPISSTRDP